MKRVLVLDANQRSALAVTRSLGSRGVPVVAADETDGSLAGASKYCETSFSYPSPRLSTNEFLTRIADAVVSHEIDIVLPMTELTTTLSLHHLAPARRVILPFAEAHVVDALADKCKLLRLAEELELPVPKTWYADGGSDSSVDLDSLPYPLVLKPARSWQQRDGRWSRYVVRIAATAAEARRILADDPAFGGPFMLQQHVSGSGQGVFALYDHGRPLAFFAHRRLREKPPSGGVSVLSESVPLDERALSYARKLLERASWHGVAMVEFKVEERTGTPYLMEVNTRFWGSLQLAIDAGVDFPWLLYRLSCGDPIPRADGYRVGVRSRWLLGDVDNLYLTLRDPVLSFRAKAAAIAAFLRPDPLRTRHEVDRWQDPRPFVFELRRYVRDLMR